MLVGRWGFGFWGIGDEAWGGEANFDLVRLSRDDIGRLLFLRRMLLSGGMGKGLVDIFRWGGGRVITDIFRIETRERYRA